MNMGARVLEVEKNWEIKERVEEVKKKERSEG